MSLGEFVDLLMGFGVVGVAILAMIALHRETKKPQYEQLMRSGQKINLNLLTLVEGFFRAGDDPLRPAHVRIAKRGLRIFGGMIFGFILVILILSLIYFILGES